MDILLTHLQKTAEQRGMVHNSQALLVFVERFRFGQLGDTEHYQFIEEKDRYVPLLVLQTLQALLKEDQLQILQYDGALGVMTARVEREYQRNQGWFATIPLRSEKLRLYFEIYVKAALQGRIDLTTNAPLDSWVEEIKHRLSDRLAKTPERVQQTTRQAHQSLNTPQATTRAQGTVLRPGQARSGMRTAHEIKANNSPLSLAQQKPTYAASRADAMLNKYKKTSVADKGAAKGILKDYRQGKTVNYQVDRVKAGKNGWVVTQEEQKTAFKNTGTKAGPVTVTQDPSAKQSLAKNFVAKDRLTGKNLAIEKFSAPGGRAAALQKTGGPKAVGSTSVTDKLGAVSRAVGGASRMAGVGATIQRVFRGLR